LPLSKLQILHNEAVRQRLLDALSLRLMNATEEGVDEIREDIKQIHGDYTEGFYEEQLELAKKYFGVIKSGRRQTNTKNSNKG